MNGDSGLEAAYTGNGNIFAVKYEIILKQILKYQREKCTLKSGETIK